MGCDIAVSEVLGARTLQCVVCVVCVVCVCVCVFFVTNSTDMQTRINKLSLRYRSLEKSNFYQCSLQNLVTPDLPINNSKQATNNNNNNITNKIQK